jgi:hypothetical protein
VESGAGAVGVSVKYAREDHVHPAFGGGGGGVTSIAGNTGAFTLSNGVINSVNDIRLNAGHLPAEPSNGNAAAGEIGEFVYGLAKSNNATCTISIASPGVITEAGHGRTAYGAVMFTTTGALPTGLVAGTTYYTLGGAALTRTPIRSQPRLRTRLLASRSIPAARNPASTRQRMFRSQAVSPRICVRCCCSPAIGKCRHPRSMSRRAIRR